VIQVTDSEAVIRGIRVPVGSFRNIGLLFNAGAGQPKGSTRFVIMATRDSVVYGGSTYVLRGQWR